MNKAMTLLINTFHKEYRSKTLIFLFSLNVVLIFLMQAISSFLEKNIEIQSMLDGALGNRLVLYYLVISVWSVFIGAIIGVNCIRSDFRDKTISQILSFPIRRWEYLVSRIIGAWLIVMAFYVLSIVLAMIVFYFGNGSLDFDISILKALSFSGLAILALILIGIFYSLFFNKIFAFCAVFFTIAGSSISTKYFLTQSAGDMFSNLGISKVIGLFFYYFVPRVGLINDLAGEMLKSEQNLKSLPAVYYHYPISIILLFLVIYFIFRRSQ